MVFTFGTPWGQAGTCEAIKATIRHMNGTVKDLSRGRLTAKWNVKLKNASVFDHSCTFYVGDGIVRAVTDFPDTEIIVMVFNKLTPPLAFWNVFVESLIKCCPGVDFGIVAGLPELVAIQFLDDGTQQVMVSKTTNHPSWGGAALGGMLFGTAGAIIGASGGRSLTTTNTRTTISKDRTAMVRYSNGLAFRGRMMNNSSLYHEIMVNMSRLSDHVGG